MRIAILCSNYYNINQETKKGTEIFSYSLITHLVKYASQENLAITAFASGDSKLPVSIESIQYAPSNSDKTLIRSGKHFIFEIALISKAFSMQDQFDLFHVNVGDGDIALPFLPFVKKPVVITLHHILNAEFTKDYFALFKKYKNAFFISVSNAQRKLLSDLNYLETIYHGVDTDIFEFNPTGGKSIMWAGRTVPEKGIDIVVEVANRLKKETKLFGIPRIEHQAWLQKTVLNKINTSPIQFTADLQRLELIEHFQTSKLFLFPVSYEESFGLVLIEAMSCGTPVVAFARGSIPEIIKDGETGFIVNPSDNDVRGNWIIKKTGIEGLLEAVERMYALPKDEYRTMREKCRKHVEEKFTIERMVESYINAYKTVINKK